MPTSHTRGRKERIQFPVTSILSLAEITEAHQTMRWFNSVPTGCHLPFLTPTRISCSTSSAHSKSNIRDIVWQMLFLQMGEWLLCRIISIHPSCRWHQLSDHNQDPGPKLYIANKLNHQCVLLTRHTGLYTEMHISSKTFRDLVLPRATVFIFHIYLLSFLVHSVRGSCSQ